MSIQAINWVLEHSDTRLGDRLVLLALANHAGARVADGAFEAWPGVETIAREARLHPRIVQEVIGRLEADGHVERRLNGAPDQRVRRDRRPNLYRILVPVDGVKPPRTPSTPQRGEAPPHPAAPDDGVKAPCTPSTSRGEGSPGDGVNVHRSTGCGEPSPEPIDEPNDEPTPPSREPRGLPPDSDPAVGGQPSDPDPPERLTADQRRARIHQAVTILAGRAADRAVAVGNRDAWIGAVAERLAGQHATAGHRLLAEHPDLPAVALAELLDPRPTPPAPPAGRADPRASAYDGQQAAAHARADRQQRVAAGEGCQVCHDTGLTIDDDGQAVTCTHPATTGAAVDPARSAEQAHELAEQLRHGRPT